MNQNVNLIYARKHLGGGSTSFTVHLYRAFKIADIGVKLLRPSKTKTANRSHQFGGYTGIEETRVTREELKEIVETEPSLLTAAERSDDLVEPELLKDLTGLGMSIVVHDPNEFYHDGKRGVYDHLDSLRLSIQGLFADRVLSKNKIFGIRPTMKAFFPSAVIIPHPYEREFSDDWTSEDYESRKTACSLARITFVKRTEMILTANSHLESSDRVVLLGSENRLYTHHRLRKMFPDFEQGKTGQPFEHGAAARAASKYKLAVDLTYFPNDGGGSQYTFMEAWDAGTVNIIHKDWLRYSGEMKDGFNCLSVTSFEELTSLIKEAAGSKTFQKKLSMIRCDSVKHLERVHDPVTIAEAYYRELTK